MTYHHLGKEHELTPQTCPYYRLKIIRAVLLSDYDQYDRISMALDLAENEDVEAALEYWDV